MRVAFFTEGNYSGKIPRDHPSMRLDVSWMCSLDATHYPINQIHDIQDEFDFGIVIIPKNKEYNMPDLIQLLKRKKKRIVVYPIDDESWIDVGQWSEYQKAIEKLI